MCPLTKKVLSAVVLLSCSLLICSSLHAQLPVYTNGQNNWNADSLGNHRVLLHFTGTGKVAKAVIPWRRRDNHPELKKIIVQDGTTGALVVNAIPGAISREAGTIFFEPVSGKGTYYVYYLPYKNEGRSNYPRGVYLKAVTDPGTGWTTDLKNKEQLPVNCTVKEFQSVNAFNSFYPMEVIATAAETQSLVNRYRQQPFLVFPESREYPVRMQDDLPYRWIQKGPGHFFTDTAVCGEYLAFQLAVYALQQQDGLRVSFTDLRAANGAVIAAKNISCINNDGVNYDGTVFSKPVSVTAGKIQSLWCGVDVPLTAAAGLYKGKALLKTGNQVTEIALQFLVRKTGLTDQPEKMTRLKWLNSTLAQENSVIAPYTPLEVSDTTVSLLGRKIMINKDGLPAKIQTYFTTEMTRIGNTANDLIIEPLHFHFYDTAGKQPLKWKSNGLQFIKKEPGTVAWQCSNTSASLQMDIAASLEFDGFLAYTVKFTALEDVAFSEINFHLPVQPELARYFMGLGLKGGNRPDTIKWKWDVTHKNQDGGWIGTVNAGLQFSLRDDHYSRPLNTNFYLQKPLVLPASWGNDNKGGIDVFLKGKSVLVNAYSGSRQLKKGDSLFYNFNLLITPFHTLNTDAQWSTKFYHKYAPVDSITPTGATVINIHHATPVNPYINYPFIEYKKLKAYIDEAHRKGEKVKIYNTIRELSNKAWELPALQSLGHEIFASGKGGGFSWLQEHAGNDYIAAWFVPELKDAALVNSGMNRWHNYYVEGMSWLVQHTGIDGIYLDDVAFDRVTMKRIKRVLTQDGHPGIVDLHSANQYNKNDGFNNSANLYMEHFPYLNRLWFGEYFDYEKNGPDFFLTEVSGIPFGLMGEMLQDGGNPWRGMLYGMTNRMPWSDNADPRPIWKLWNDFGMKGSEMIGYWSGNCPVKTSDPGILATVYQKNGTALVSIASWADTDTEVDLLIDWKKLGMDPAKAVISAPAVINFQPARLFTPGEKIKVDKNKGWLLLIK